MIQIYNYALPAIEYLSAKHLPFMASNSSCDTKASMCPPTGAHSDWALTHEPGPKLL